MPKYRTNVVMLNGTTVKQRGEFVQLTEEQAARHLEKGNVSIVDETGVAVESKRYEESEFRALSAEEQKAVVAKYNGNLDELTNKDLRWEYVEGHQ